MPLDAKKRGSPDWWFCNLTEQLAVAIASYEENNRYASGNHPLPNIDPRYEKSLQPVLKKARTNFIGMSAKAPVERMRIRGARFGEDGKADADSRKIFAQNQWDAQLQDLLMNCSIHGKAYIMVSPPLEGQEWPVMTAEDPMMTITVQNPLIPNKSDVGVKVWFDIASGTLRGVMSTDELDFWYQGPSYEDFRRAYEAEVDLYYAVAEQFDLVDVQPNPMGECRIVQVEWQPGGISQMADLKDPQDRINQMVLDRLVIARNQAYRQRWMTGAAPVRGKDKKRAPFNPGSDMLWVTDNQGAKFGDFAQADIRQILEAARDDIISLAAIAKVPPHYLMGAISNVSGDTLTAGESGFVSMIRQRMATVGWGHEKALKLCFKFLGQTEKAEDVDCEIIWADPEVRNRAELADAAIKEASMFATAPPYAIPLLMKRAGYDPDEIAYAVEEAEKFQQQQQEREDALAEQAHQNQMAVGEQAAKAAKDTASAAKKTAGSAAAGKSKPASKAGKNSPGGSK